MPSKAYRDRHKKAGLCTECTAPATEGRYCLPHLLTNRVYKKQNHERYAITQNRAFKERYYRLKHEGKCTNCGVPLIEGETSLCVNCMIIKTEGVI